MKILHTVEFYHPSTGGMQEVVKQISERLVKLGHNVTVATGRNENRVRNINRVEVKSFDISGNMALGLRGNIKEYQDFLLNSDFDVMTNFAAQQWATDIALPLLNKIKAKKVFVPTGFSSLYRPSYSNYFESMKDWMKIYDMNIFLSNNYRDINFARKHGVKKLKVIPNGASEEEFTGTTQMDIRAILGIPVNHFLILHVGSHTGLKGHKEAIKIFKRAKILNTTLLIISNSETSGCTLKCMARQALFKVSLQQKLSGKNLIIANLERKKTVAAYHEADIFLFPSNVECSPLVLFECMASKTPFLSTDVGNAAEIIEWSKAGILLPTNKKNDGRSVAKIRDSANILESIYNSSDLREEMAGSGFDTWNNRFTWKKISLEYESLYRSLLEKRQLQ